MRPKKKKKRAFPLQRSRAPQILKQMNQKKEKGKFLPLGVEGGKASAHSGKGLLESQKGKVKFGKRGKGSAPCTGGGAYYQ